MSRSLLAVLGLGVALGACGEKFGAGSGVGGNAGASSAARSGAGSAGAPTHASAGTEDGAGADADGGAGESSADAGTGGTLDTGGTGNAGGSRGGAGGLLSVSGGGNGGRGGAFGDPELPQAGLLVWLRADRGVQQKDGHVQVWQDQSGNQIHATQAGVSLRPTYLADGFNGRPTLEFDGQQQFLKFADGFGDFGEGLTGFVVAEPTASDCASMVELSNGSEIDDIALGMWQNKWTYEVASPFIQTGNVDPERFTLYAVNQRVVGASELRIDGNVLATLDMPLPVVPDSGIRVNNFVGHTLYGGCSYFQGQISEIILYSRTLPNLDVRAIEKYLDGHWALSEQASPTPTP